MITPDPNHDWVLAAPFRAHVRHLLDSTGLPWPVVALEAGIPPALVRHLLYGRRGRRLSRIPPGSAVALLRLDSTALLGTAVRRVPAASTASRLAQLLAQGLPAAQLARFCRMTESELEVLLEAPTCSRLTAHLVEAAHLLHRAGPARCLKSAA